jgi:hypothetical protein
MELALLYIYDVGWDGMHIHGIYEHDAMLENSPLIDILDNKHQIVGTRTSQ